MTKTRTATQWGDRDQRRIDILRAGEELLRAGGYSALRMRDVADGAGISLGAVYTYFSTKENLFIGLFADHVVRLTEELRPLITTSDFTTVFTAFANAYRDQYRVFGKQFDALELLHDADSLDPAVAEHLREATGGLIALLSEALVSQGFEGDPRPAMVLLWSTVTGLANHYTSARQEFLGVSWDSEVVFAAERLGRALGLALG